MKLYVILLFLTQVVIVLCGYARHYKVQVDPGCFKNLPSWLNLTVFYNSRCNRSAQFFSSQLLPVWRKFKHYIGLELVPFGNSTLIEHPIDPFENWYSFEFTSQFGPEDCLSNKLHACVLMYPKELLKIAKPQTDLKKSILQAHVILLSCLMSYENQLEALQKCAYEYHPSEIKQLQECVRTSEGSYYLAEHGRRTSKYFPHIRDFPFIAINNTNRIHFTRKAMTDLEYVICAHLPKLCRLLMTTTPTPWPLTGHWFIT